MHILIFIKFYFITQYEFIYNILQIKIPLFIFINRIPNATQKLLKGLSFTLFNLI